MNFFALSGLLTGFSSLVFGYFVYTKGRTRQLNRFWFVFTASVAVWGFGGMWIALASTSSEAMWAWRLAFACGVVWIPILFCQFVHAFCHLPSRTFLIFSYLVGAVFSPLAFTDQFFSGVRFAFSSFYYALPGRVFPLFLAWWVGLVVYSHYQLYKAHRGTSGQKRSQIEYFFLATAIGYFGGSLDYLPIFGIDLYPYGNFAIVLYPIIMTYAIVQYRLMDITVAMEKGLTYLLVLLAVGILAYPILLVTQEAFLGSVSHSFSVTLVLLFTLLLLGTHGINFKAQTAIGRALFKERYDKYQTLSEFSKSLVTILDLNALTGEIVRTLVNVLGAKAAFLYLFDLEKAAYVLSASLGQETEAVKAMRFMQEDVLPRYLAHVQSILVREELEHSGEVAATDPLLHALNTMEAEVSIPLINKGRLIGFCNLGSRTNLSMYSHEDLNLLETLGQNAAIALDNAILYKDLKRSQGLLRRTDRLRSLETIAGGFAHEIRNPLTSIKTFVQLAHQRKDDPEFMVEFSAVVQDDVLRIERLIEEILDYARYMEPKFSDEDLNEIVAICLHFVEIQADQRSITIEKDLAVDLPRVTLDRQQIKQVLMNLILNAMDAMATAGGQLTVRTHRLTKPTTGDLWVQIEVADTGCGIAGTDLEHIFDPFYTTKHESQEREGTGLGLVIVHQIVQEHSGHVEVESEVGKGTTFLVNLPVNPAPVGVPRAGSKQG